MRFELTGTKLQRMADNKCDSPVNVYVYTMKFSKK